MSATGARRFPRWLAPELLAGSVVLAVYSATLARTVTRWDSGEFIAAVHSLGIPHPPGTPVYVLAARAWATITWPLPYAVRVNLFSAVCAAAAVTILGMLLRRWTGRPVVGGAATLCAGATATLWLSATEAEVYAPALLAATLTLWVADSTRAGDARRFALLAFLVGIGWSVHPGALVLVPAVVVLLLDRGSLELRLASHPVSPDRLAARGNAVAAKDRARRPVLLLAAAAVLGVSSILYLIVRAQQDPAINQGNPASLGALWEVLTRAQYQPHGLWPRQAPLWIQLGNWFAHADWQFARGLAPSAPASWSRTPVTIVFALLGIAGSLWHRRLDRRSWRALAVGMLGATIGLILYLNLKAGPSFGEGVLPEGAPREARERDYFFVASFALWGAWAGMGAVVLARRVAAAPGDGRNRIQAAAAGGALAIAAAPLLLNFGYAYDQRARASHATRAAAVAMLQPLPEGAVFLALGDNDTYPLWYLQQAEGMRRDVTVVTVPLLGAGWYRAEMARRHDLLDTAAAGTLGTLEAVREVCNRATALSRPLALTPFAEPRTLEGECPNMRRR